MQTSPIIPAHLLLESLMDQLELFSFQWRFQWIGHYGPCLRLAAQHPATGDLVLWVEDNEITLVIELITHSHFTCPSYLLNSSLEAQAKGIAQEAADYVLDVLLDRILFEMEWQGDRITSVSNIPLINDIPPKAELPQGVRRERFLWSGPCQEAI